MDVFDPVPINGGELSKFLGTSWYGQAQLGLLLRLSHNSCCPCRFVGEKESYEHIVKESMKQVLLPRNMFSPFDAES